MNHRRDNEAGVPHCRHVTKSSVWPSSYQQNATQAPRKRAEYSPEKRALHRLPPDRIPLSASRTICPASACCRQASIFAGSTLGFRSRTRNAQRSTTALIQKQRLAASVPERRQSCVNRSHFKENIQGVFPFQVGDIQFIQTRIIYKA